MFFYIDRMFLNQVAELINRKDVRAVRTWCEKNQVKIYKDWAGEYVIKNDFDLAYDMPLILNLKAKYGDEWQLIYEAYNKDELYKMLDMEPKAKEIPSRYIPKGEIAIKQHRKSN